MGPTVLQNSCKKSNLQALKRLVSGIEDESIYKLVPDGRLPGAQGADKSSLLYPSDHDDLGAPKINKYKKGPLPSHIDSSQVDNLLRPPKGIREEMRELGITPRDHTRDNRAAILEQSERNRASKEQALTKIAEDFAATEKQKLRKIKAEPLVPFKPKRTIDFVSKNLYDAVTKQPPRPIQAKDYRQKENYGKIPAYLLRRKIELAQDAEQRLLQEKAKKLPPGVIQMKDDERIDVLKTLESNKQELENRLSCLPLYVETPSQVKVKTTLDSQLRDIEESIRRFSKSTVYIAQE